MLLSHIVQLVIPKIIIPNFFEWAALGKAFILLPKIIRRRNQVKPKAKLSDQEIFGKFKPWIKYLK